jgi:hypothetical protein
VNEQERQSFFSDANFTVSVNEELGQKYYTAGVRQYVRGELLKLYYICIYVYMYACEHAHTCSSPLAACRPRVSAGHTTPAPILAAGGKVPLHSQAPRSLPNHSATACREHVAHRQTDRQTDSQRATRRHMCNLMGRYENKTSHDTFRGSSAGGSGEVLGFISACRKHATCNQQHATCNMQHATSISP